MRNWRGNENAAAGAAVLLFLCLRDRPLRSAAASREVAALIRVWGLSPGERRDAADASSPKEGASQNILLFALQVPSQRCGRWPVRSS